MKLLLFFIPLLFAVSPVQENTVAEEDFFPFVRFTYSQDFNNCNTFSNPCATMDFQAIAAGGTSVWWNFGPYVCTSSTSGNSATASFNTMQIFNATGQSGYQYIPVTVFMLDFNGNVQSRTQTIRIIVC